LKIHDFKNAEFLKDTNGVSGTSEWNEVSVSEVTKCLEHFENTQTK